MTKKEELDLLQELLDLERLLDKQYPIPIYSDKEKSLIRNIFSNRLYADNAFIDYITMIINEKDFVYQENRQLEIEMRIREIREILNLKNHE